MQCNQEFSLLYNSSLNIPELYFKVAHPKVQCNQEFFLLYNSSLNIPELYFKVMHPKVQCNQSFLFARIAINFYYHMTRTAPRALSLQNY